MDDAEGAKEGPESDTTDTPESVRSAGGRRELLRRPLDWRRPELPPSLLVPEVEPQHVACNNSAPFL